jgi:hypothetical protein
LGDEKVQFVTIPMEKKFPFLPEVKVNLSLKELGDQFGLQ